MKTRLNEVMTEEEVLNELNENLGAAVDGMLSEYDNDPDYQGDERITIIVNGVSHKLVLGGPQVTGIDLLIKHICDENGYGYPARECDK